MRVREDEAQEGDEEETGEAERDLQEPVAHLLAARAEEAGAGGGLAREQVEERDVQVRAGREREHKRREHRAHRRRRIHAGRDDRLPVSAPDCASGSGPDCGRQCAPSARGSGVKWASSEVQARGCGCSGRVEHVRERRSRRRREQRGVKRDWDCVRLGVWGEPRGEEREREGVGERGEQRATEEAAERHERDEVNEREAAAEADRAPAGHQRRGRHHHTERQRAQHLVEQVAEREHRELHPRLETRQRQALEERVRRHSRHQEIHLSRSRTLVYRMWRYEITASRIMKFSHNINFTRVLVHV